MITVSQLWKYPLKSGRGQSLSETRFDSAGMRDDRRLIVLDQQSVFITARKHGRLLQVSCTRNDGGWLLEFHPKNSQVQINEKDLVATTSGSLWKDTIHALDAGDEAAAWLSEILEVEVRIAVWKNQARYSNKYQLETSFSDASPILVASTASVQQACEWGGIEPDVRRFRPNIVVEGIEAFEEDAWQRFRIGDAEFEVLDTCVRCVLTTINPDSGDRHPKREPMVSLMNRHANESGQPLFGVNVRLIDQAENVSISVGDTIQLL